MPQIILECSDNILEKDMTSLLLQIHQLLTDKLPTQLQSCKSRVLRHQDYVVANNDEKNAFVHLSIGVLKGRSHELLNSIATTILQLLKTSFSLSLAELNLQLSIAIRDLPDVYEKYDSPIA